MNSRITRFPLEMAAAFLLVCPAGLQAVVNISPATGGANISADTAGNAPVPAWTSLERIAIVEASPGDIVRSGTLVLKAPAGFEFNTAAEPSVTYTLGRNITYASVTMADSQTMTISLTLNGTSALDGVFIGSVNPIQVRPVSGTVLLSGSIYRPVNGSGTIPISGIAVSGNANGSGGTSLGLLSARHGAARSVSWVTAPSGTVRAGDTLSPATVVELHDQFGNRCTTDNSTVVTAQVASGGATLFGTITRTSIAGVASFSNLSLRQAGTVALRFSIPSGGSVDSGAILVTPGQAAILAFRTQPGSTVMGAPLNPQPVVVSQDPYGNDSSIGLAASVPVALSLSTGTGTLGGQTVADLGTAAGNGTAAFSGLNISASGSGKRLSATSPGLASAVSAAFDIGAASTLFADSFSRSTLPPWVTRSGDWQLPAGQLSGGPNSPFSYGVVYTADDWADVTAQGQIQLSAGGYGGGLGVRVNTQSGAQYAAWVYPETTPGGVSLVKLLKFSAWDNFAYNNVPAAPMAEVQVPGAGTNWHGLKLVCYGQRLAVYYDGIQVINMVDTEPQRPASGGVSLQFWTGLQPYTARFDNIRVEPWIGPMASNDVFGVVAHSTLIVPAPGLFANDLAAGSNLVPVLVSAPARGNLSLNAQGGGFSYTPEPGFVGSDTFTYRCTDGLGESQVATVTLTVAANNRPTAIGEAYTLSAYSALSLPTPGVLGNDSDPDNHPLRALLVSGPAQGTLVLGTNGGLTYAPPPGFTGQAAFTYQASDGITNSEPVTVTLSVGPAPVPLFADSFARTAEPGALEPWSLRSGAWSVTGGVLIGGPNSANSYGQVYTTHQWTDYSVEARIRFAEGAYGGGLGGRVDPVTGARYAAWLYPAGAQGTNFLRLLKFRDWAAFAYTNVSSIPMSQVIVPPLGTDWHTLKLQFDGSQISVHLDGTALITMTDAELLPYSFGGVSLEMWTDLAGYQMLADNVLVRAPGSVPTPVRAAIARQGSQVRVTFTGEPNATYQVQSTASLVPPIAWTPVSTNTAAQDGIWTYDAPANAPRLFFRCLRP